MATVTKKISLDVSRKNLLPNIIAKQFDTDSRFLTVTLLDEGEPIKAASDSEVIVSFRRKDGHAKSFKGAANGDGTVTVPLANWALELDDIVECDISVYQGEVRLSTTTFRLEVQPAANGSDEISKDENYDVLGQLIVEVSEAIEEASTAASAANTAKAEADAARDKANTAADNADEKAKAAEEKATLAETAAGNADEKANLANEAAEAANTAAAEAGKWKNVNVSAKGLAEGAAPTATLTETEDGKAFEFGIPKGDKGDTGPQGPTGSTGPQGPKGDDATPSSTVPLPPADTGSVGNESAYARGDHVHPIGTVHADNFEGILPIGKGGTGNSAGYIPVVAGNEFRPSVGNESETLYIGYVNGWKNYRFDTNPTTPGNIICGSITSPSIPSIATTSTAGLVKPGTGLSVSLDGTLSTTVNIMATQLALTSLYESRSVSAASADTPMSSPSIDGELPDLDQNMIKVYADLCLNPDSGKSVDDVPENLRAYVSQIVEETLAKRKEAEERYKAEMKKREEEERRKAEEEKAKAEAEAEEETAPDGETTESAPDQTSPEPEESEDTSPADTGNDEKEEP